MKIVKTGAVIVDGDRILCCGRKGTHFKSMKFGLFPNDQVKIYSDIDKAKSAINVAGYSGKAMMATVTIEVDDEGHIS